MSVPAETERRLELWWSRQVGRGRDSLLIGWIVTRAGDAKRLSIFQISPLFLLYFAATFLKCLSSEVLLEMKGLRFRLNVCNQSNAL